MPVFHEYKYKEGYYIKSRVKGNLVTYQLSYDGEQKLLSEGFIDNDKIPQSLFFELFESNDIYTNRGGISGPIDDEYDDEYFTEPFMLPKLESRVKNDTVVSTHSMLSKTLPKSGLEDNHSQLINLELEKSIPKNSYKNSNMAIELVFWILVALLFIIGIFW